MNKKLIQLQIVPNIPKDSQNRPILSATLGEFDTPVKEIENEKEFKFFFKEFIKKNTSNYDKHLLISKKLKFGTNDKLEITYYFTPSSLPVNLLHYKVDIENAKTVFESDEATIVALAIKIYSHITEIAKKIKLDNGDDLADISIENFTKLK